MCGFVISIDIICLLYTIIFFEGEVLKSVLYYQPFDNVISERFPVMWLSEYTLQQFLCLCNYTIYQTTHASLLFCNYLTQ